MLRNQSKMLRSASKVKLVFLNTASLSSTLTPSPAFNPSKHIPLAFQRPTQLMLLPHAAYEMLEAQWLEKLL